MSRFNYGALPIELNDTSKVTEFKGMYTNPYAPMDSKLKANESAISELANKKAIPTVNAIFKETKNGTDYYEAVCPEITELYDQMIILC